MQILLITDGQFLKLKRGCLFFYPIALFIYISLLPSISTAIQILFSLVVLINAIIAIKICHLLIAIHLSLH